MAELHFEPQTRRAGAITQHLRALAPLGPKVLRVAWVRGGRVLEERVLKQPGHITIGESEKNVFVVANSRASLRLFAAGSEGYVLKLAPGMSARVALSADGELTDVQGVDTPELRLSTEARGRICVGQDTFLFQFVVPAPVQPKAQLPVAVVHGALEIDIATTTIAALSFLLHFLTVGALYSDWLDPVVDSGVVVSGLLENINALPAPIDSVEEANSEVPAPVATSVKEPAPAPVATAPMAGETKPSNGAQEAALVAQLDQLELATIGSLNSAGPATAGVLKGGEVPTSALDAAAASQAGVSAGGFVQPGKGDRLRPGQSADLASLATRQRSVESNEPGQQVAVAGPKGSVSVSATDTRGGIISDAPRVVAGMRAGFRQCYNRGLDAHPDASGSIRLSIHVGPGGEVQNVDASPSGNLPGSIVSCVRTRAYGGLFSPPEGGSAVVMVPVSLIKLPR